VTSFAEPPVRTDGRCIVCLKQLRIDGLRPLYKAAMRDEPFCSTECCREWYCIPLPSEERKRRRYRPTLPPAA
jgi:hypothetical protein